MLKVSIRPIQGEDVDVLIKCLLRGHPDIHRERYHKQEQGTGLYAIAWHKENPVANLFVDWEGSDVEPVKSNFPNCPLLVDLYVLAEYRRSGIAAQLLEYAETIARDKGYKQIGLNVGDLNDPNYRIAYNIYKSRGYRDSGLGEYPNSYKALDENGKEIVIKEKYTFLIKELTSANV